MGPGVWGYWSNTSVYGGTGPIPVCMGVLVQHQCVWGYWSNTSVYGVTGPTPVCMGVLVQHQCVWGYCHTLICSSASNNKQVRKSV